MADVRRFGDLVEGDIRAAFLAAVDAALQLVSATELEGLIRRRDVAGIMALAERAVAGGLVPAMAPFVDAVTKVAAAAALSTAGLGASLTLINERALAWAREHAAQRVYQFGVDVLGTLFEVTDRTLRQEVEAVLGGDAGNVQAMGRRIRGAVGMLPSHAKAAERYEEKLRADGVPEDKIARNVATYRRRLVAWRAEGVARTETMEAAHAGLVEGWRAAIEAGRLPSDIQMEWDAQEDKLTCERCAPLDGKRVPVRDGEFVADRKGFPDGVPQTATPASRRRRKTGIKPGTRKAPIRDESLDGVLVELKPPIRVGYPPLHPRCRCTLRLVVPPA